MDTPKAIGERLLLARRRQALTQAEVADKAGVGALTVSRIERGDFQDAPRPSTVRKITDALGIKPAWLLYGESEEGKAAA